MMGRIPNYIFFIAALFICTAVKAQNFKNKAALNAVAKTGFYSIEVTPEVSSYTSTDYRDLRIIDEQNRSVPYIIKGANADFFERVHNTHFY